MKRYNRENERPEGYEDEDERPEGYENEDEDGKGRKYNSMPINKE